MNSTDLVVNTPSAALSKNKLREYPMCFIRGRAYQMIIRK